MPVNTFSDKVQEFADEVTCHAAERRIDRSGCGEGQDGRAQIPWPVGAVGVVNAEIARGGTGIDDTYTFTEIWREVPMNLLHQVLDKVRQRALVDLASRASADELATRIVSELPSRPADVSVSGTGNQVIVASPGASATLSIAKGDHAALDAALASLGISGDSIDKLHGTLAEAPDESSRVMKALTWSREAAKEIGISTAGGAAATLVLQYLGQLL